VICHPFQALVQSVLYFLRNKSTDIFILKIFTVFICFCQEKTVFIQHWPAQSRVSCISHISVRFSYRQYFKVFSILFLEQLPGLFFSFLFVDSTCADTSCYCRHTNHSYSQHYFFYFHLSPHTFLLSHTYYKFLISKLKHIAIVKFCLPHCL